MPWIEVTFASQQMPWQIHQSCLKKRVNIGYAQGSFLLQSLEETG
jgi:hypothetical protein